MTTASELRPADPADARVWDAASTVHDPEIPVLSIADLGILREARADGERAVVVITPTYSGCPAMDTITTDVTRALERAGFPDAVDASLPAIEEWLASAARTRAWRLTPRRSARSRSGRSRT